MKNTYLKKKNNGLKSKFFAVLKSVGVTMILLLAMACGDSDCEYDTYDPCGGSANRPMVDLIILIDTSGSMGTFAAQVSNEAQAGIDVALADCDSDLRVMYLGVDGTFGSTNFTTSHRDYLNALPGAPFPLAADLPPSGFLGEQGANAVEDLSNYFDWRDGACRSIFYISDEELDGSSPRGDTANEDLSTANAILGAQSNSVTVFSNYLTYQGLGASILQNYSDLTTQTGGLLFATNSNPLPANYYVDNNVFGDIVCNACNGCTN
jgi:hypothetical protein